MASSPYEPSSPEMLAEIIRQAEARLAAQLTAGVAADQRAMTFAGLLLAAAAVLFGAALTAALPPLRLGLMVVVGIAQTLSAGMAIWTAQPSDWDYVGNVPSEWLGDVGANRSLHSAMAETASWYDEMIAGNETVVATAAKVMRRAVWLAVFAMALGSIGGLALVVGKL